MKYISYVILLSLISMISHAAQINFHATCIERLQDRFTIKTSNQFLQIPNYQVSKPIRDLTPEKLAAVLNSRSHYLSAHQLSDGSYVLDLNGRLPGEGIGGISLGGLFGYEGSKVLFIAASTGCLILAQGAVHVCKGPEAGALFKAQITDRFMPHIEEIAEKFVGPVGAVIGAGAAAVSPTP